MSKPVIPKEELTEMQIRILNALKTGHKDATPLKELCRKTQIPNRKLRMVIESLRREGYAILIPKRSPYGYFFPADRKELNEYTDYMRSRLIEEYHTYKLVRKATLTKIEKSFGQLPLYL